MELIIRFLLVLLFCGASAQDLGTYSSCFSEHMLVQVDLTQNPTLVAGEMHLNDINCRATGINVTFASFEIPLSGCGTIRDGSDPDVLVFSNTVRWDPQQPPGQTQTRIAGFRSRIICRYARNGTVSVSLEPVQELSVEQTVYGTLSFSFEIFEDANRQIKRDLDVLVIPGTPLYFRVRVISPDSDLILHLSRCWARNSDGVGPPAFIEEGCNSGTDDTLVYQCDATSPIQDFDLIAFRILNSPNNLVFFFCDVLVCLNNANGSICEDRCDNCTEPGAGGGNGRKRRSLEENGYDSGSNTYSLAAGPFSVKEQDDGEDLKNQGDIDETGTQLSLAMVIVLCVASLVAVALICGTVVVVVMYKRWSAKHEARTSERIIPPATRAKKPKVLKI